MSAFYYTNPSSMDRVEVKRSKIHGKGLFAVDALKENTCIGEYTGKIEEADESEQDVECCFKVHCTDFAINKKEVIQGTGHLIFTNHSKRPNCVARIHRRRIHFYTKRRVAKGDELTIDYKCACKRCSKK